MPETLPPDKVAELAAIVDEIRGRVREGRGSEPLGEEALTDLMPLWRARNAAEAKVAGIGALNPRPPGLVNNLIQSVKRTLSRATGWMYRPQVEFNESVVNCISGTLDALNENNRLLRRIMTELDRQNVRYEREMPLLPDLQGEWHAYRGDWERRLLEQELRHRDMAWDAQQSQRLALAALEERVNTQLRAQVQRFAGDHARIQQDLSASLAKMSGELQASFWAELHRIRLDYERLIHQELRVVRQKMLAAPAAAAPSALPAQPTLTPFDYQRFADRFRGSEEHVREQLQPLAAYFQGCRHVVDLGCGRGEFLDLLRAANIPARGVESSAECVSLCAARGLHVEQADLFTWLEQQADSSLDGIFCSQVIEHLPVALLPRLVDLCARKLQRGGVLLMETPNPESLAIFATHFYLDPTHQRPIPPHLLVFLYEEAGLGAIEILRRSPAVETMPALQELPAAVRDAFFGALDYAAVGRKL